MVSSAARADHPAMANPSSASRSVIESERARRILPSQAAIQALAYSLGIGQKTSQFTSGGAELLPQRRLVHFAGRVSWQGLDEPDRSRMLVMREICLAMQHDLGFGQW